MFSKKIVFITGFGPAEIQIQELIIIFANLIYASERERERNIRLIEKIIINLVYILIQTLNEDSQTQSKAINTKSKVF